MPLTMVSSELKPSFESLKITLAETILPISTKWNFVHTLVVYHAYLKAALEQMIYVLLFNISLNLD